MELNEAVYKIKLEVLERTIEELELYLEELNSMEDDEFTRLEIRHVMTMIVCKESELRNLKDIVH